MFVEDADSSLRYDDESPLKRPRATEASERTSQTSNTGEDDMSSQGSHTNAMAHGRRADLPFAPAHHRTIRIEKPSQLQVGLYIFHNKMKIFQLTIVQLCKAQGFFKIPEFYIFSNKIINFRTKRKTTVVRACIFGERGSAWRTCSAPSAPSSSTLSPSPTPSATMRTPWRCLPTSARKSISINRTIWRSSPRFVARSDFSIYCEIFLDRANGRVAS